MKDSSLKILVAGATGFLGSRVVKRLKDEGLNFVGTSLSMGVDFRDMSQLEGFFAKEKPNIVINCAAFVGGIKFGLEHEAEIFYNNVLINTNLIECSRRYGVGRYVNPISNCSYPNVLEKDFKEEEWWDGPLHPSVMVYGFAKKATWVQSYAYHNQYGMDFVNLLVPNMYGPGDHFHEERSHALGALIMKIAKAKREGVAEVVVWGTGSPVREWLYVDDCVEIFLRALDINLVNDPINIGCGSGISIAEMAEVIKSVVKYEGELVFDTSKPDGAPYKVMNVDKMKKIFDYTPSTKLEEGIKVAVDWYYENVLNI